MIFDIAGIGKKIEDAVIVDLVHGHQNRVIGVRTHVDGDIAYVRELR